MRATRLQPLSLRALSRRGPVHPFFAGAELDPVWRELDRWAAAVSAAPRRSRLDRRPTVTHDEEAGTWSLATALPGVPAEHLDITLAQGVLTIETKPSLHEDDGFTTVVRERPHPKHRIRWTLPEQADADTVAARLVDGWLTVTVSAQARPVARKIAVVAS